MNTTTRGCIPWLFEEIEVNASACGPMGASVRTLETLVAENVQAVIDFSYTPGYPAQNLHGRFEDAMPAEPAEVAIRSIKTIQDYMAQGEEMDMVIKAGYDLLNLLPEREVEKLEEMIIARAENKERA